MRAATEGRILVLEGLEKAERNVLPVLNNLLENREMQLEDGRFLMSYQRYDKLLTVRPVCGRIEQCVLPQRTKAADLTLSPAGAHQRGAGCVADCACERVLPGHRLGTSCPPVQRQPLGPTPPIPLPSQRHLLPTLQG